MLIITRSSCLNVEDTNGQQGLTCPLLVVWGAALCPLCDPLAPVAPDRCEAGGVSCAPPPPLNVTDPLAPERPAPWDLAVLGVALSSSSTLSLIVVAVRRRRGWVLERQIISDYYHIWTYVL